MSTTPLTYKKISIMPLISNPSPQTGMSETNSDSIVGYELDGTPATKQNLILSLQKAEQDYAEGLCSTHKEVIKEMADLITQIANVQV